MVRTVDVGSDVIAAQSAANITSSVSAERHPILIHDNAVAVLSVFSSDDGSWIEDLWTIDYLNDIRPWEVGASQLVSRLAENACVAFWQALHFEIAREIDRHNARWGTAFSYDPPTERSAATPQSTGQGNGRTP